MASTTSHPVTTSAATAPAVILAFSFVVYPRINGTDHHQDAPKRKV
jgi:hypothetical protein